MIRAALRPFLAAGCWLLFLLGAFPALAQESSAQGSSKAYLSAMTGPFERVEAVFAEMGIPVPKSIRRETIEEKLPFIGEDGLRADGSIGMWMVPKESDSAGPNGILLFHV